MGRVRPGTYRPEKFGPPIAGEQFGCHLAKSFVFNKYVLPVERCFNPMPAGLHRFALLPEGDPPLIALFSISCAICSVDLMKY